MANRTLALLSGGLLLAGAVAWLALDGVGRATARSSSRAHKTISFSYDWDTSNSTATLYTVPAGMSLVVTDVCAYWWGSGPAQRVYVYQDSEVKASFLASGRGSDASTHLNIGASCFSSSQAGIAFGPGTQVRAVPSTTYLSVTMAGYLER